MKVIVIANQKGGVGKTTTAVNLATALSVVGKNICILDFDPQGNASTSVGISLVESGAYALLLGQLPFHLSMLPTKIPRLFIIPSSNELAGAEIELVGQPNRAFFLNQRIKKIDTSIDYLIIDCPPSLGLLTLNALVAADAVLVPLQCEFFALEGITALMRTIGRVKKTYNPNLAIQGIVLTMFDKRNNLSSQVESNVREYFGEKVYKAIIPRNVRLSEAPSHGKPALVYDLNCPGSQAYLSLAKEFIQQEGILT
jgi:chromosome partitioning protein